MTPPPSPSAAEPAPAAAAVAIAATPHAERPQATADAPADGRPPPDFKGSPFTLAVVQMVSVLMALALGALVLLGAVGLAVAVKP
jgi:hypothetical protein